MDVARPRPQCFEDEQVDELDDRRLIRQRTQVVDRRLIVGQQHDVAVRAGRRVCVHRLVRLGRHDRRMNLGSRRIDQPHGRSYVHASSSSTVGSSGAPAATSNSSASVIDSGIRQCSSRYLGDSRRASGPAAPARRSVARPRRRAAHGTETDGAGGAHGATEGGVAHCAACAGWRRRQRAVDLRTQELQLLSLLVQQRVRLLVRRHDVRRQEDRQLGPLVISALGLEQGAEERDVLQDAGPRSRCCFASRRSGHRSRRCAPS